MGKFKKLMVAMLVSLVTVTGCGNKKNSLSLEETTKKMNSNMESLQNYKVKLDAGLKAKKDDEEIDMSLVANFDIDMKNKKMKMNISFAGMDQKIYIDTYIITNDNNKSTVYLKNPDTNEWVKVDTDSTELSEAYLQGINFDPNKAKDEFTKILNNEKFKQVNPDKENYNYEMNITAEDIQKIIDTIVSQLGNNDKSLTSSIAMIKSYLANIKESIKIKVSFEKENYYLSNISLDIKEFVNELIKTLGGDEINVTISRADVSLTISNFNKNGDVEVPKDIVENAIDALEESKANAVKDTAYGIKNAAQLYYQMKILEGNGNFAETTFTCNGVTCVDSNNISLEISETIPSAGTITINNAGGVTGNLTFDKMECTIPSSGEIECK